MLRTLAPLNLRCIATPQVPFDLHVLSTPPAFVLSQNQTLREKFVPTRLAGRQLLTDYCRDPALRFYFKGKRDAGFVRSLLNVFLSKILTYNAQFNFCCHCLAPCPAGGIRGVWPGSQAFLAFASVCDCLPPSSGPLTVPGFSVETPESNFQRTGFIPAFGRQKTQLDPTFGLGRLALSLFFGIGGCAPDRFVRTKLSQLEVPKAVRTTRVSFLICEPPGISGEVNVAFRFGSSTGFFEIPAIFSFRAFPPGFPSGRAPYTDRRRGQRDF